MLKSLPYREVKRRLEAAVYFEISSKCSHVKFIHQTEQGTRVVIVPHHRKVVVGALHSILRQAGLSPDEFEAL